MLVRARNDEALIGRTREGGVAQKADFPFEVVVCDDASTDRTREVAERFPVRFFERPAGEYRPGRTLNALVRDARGGIVVFNNSDAVPVGDDWLAELVRPLLEEPDRPTFCFANQLPRADATALVRKDSERAFGDGRVQASWRFFFSLASSATRRALLLETPFDETIQYSEDVEWAWRNSRRAERPVRILYRPNALVEHSHNYTLRELAKRFRGEGAADRRIFGDAPSLPRELASAARETLRDWAYLLPRPRNWLEIPSAPVRRLVQRVNHWKGARSADRSVSCGGNNLTQSSQSPQSGLGGARAPRSTVTEDASRQVREVREGELGGARAPRSPAAEDASRQVREVREGEGK